RIEMQHDVPAERGDPPHELVELAEIGRAAEMGNEVEADAADAAVVEPFELRIRDRTVDVRDAAIAAAALRDRIEDHGIVGAVTARVHEHGALEPQRLLQLD